jgi:hypothetical protein
MAGWQCHKLLWWMVHEPEASELQLDDLGAAVMEQGTRVGELARTYVPGGFLVDLPYNAIPERLAETEQAIACRAPVIYEAAFRADNVFVSVDIAVTWLAAAAPEHGGRRQGHAAHPSQGRS